MEHYQESLNMPISPERQDQRRKQILAKTRELIRQNGIKALNIRDLAAFCGVSVPTLYNQFGNKDGLLKAAGEEVFLQHYDNIIYPPNSRGLMRILFIDGKNVDMILENGELSVYLTRAGRVASDSLSAAQRAIGEAIDEIKQQGDLVDWIDSHYIAGRIYARARGVVAEWAIGAINDDQLRRIRRNDMALALLGVTTGETHASLKQMLIDDRSHREKNHS